MSVLTLIFGLLSGCFLSVLVGIIGSRRRIGFGWAFLLSVIFTPLVGLVIALLTDPLPGGDQRWGCIGTFVAVLGMLFLAAFLFLLLTGGTMLLALWNPPPSPCTRRPSVPISGYSSRRSLPGRRESLSDMPTATISMCSGW